MQKNIKTLLTYIYKVHSLTCKARRTDAGIAMNKVDTRGIVQAGGRHALIYVNLAVGPWTDIKRVSDHKRL